MLRHVEDQNATDGLKYLHFICLPIDLVNSSQCCGRETGINVKDQMLLNCPLVNSRHHIVQLTPFSCYYRQLSLFVSPTVLKHPRAKSAKRTPISCSFYVKYIFLLLKCELLILNVTILNR